MNAHYHPCTLPVTKEPILVIIAGPSGSGKSTLCDRLVQDDPEFRRVVTTTSRLPRQGEIDGVHYHFFHPDEFERRIAADEFIEWTKIHADKGDDRYRYYGTLRSSVFGPLSRGQSLVMNINVDGVDAFRALMTVGRPLHGIAMTVFIELDIQRLRQRILERADTPPDELERRMVSAAAELRRERDFDFVIRSTTRDEDFAALREYIGIGKRYNRHCACA